MGSPRTSNGWRPLKVNTRNLINDFLDAYSSEPEEVMVVESIANCLDAKAHNITISLHQTPQGTIYSILDDGKGMSELEFEDSYHALALSTKAKGETIGFAGIGSKLYLVMLEAGNAIYTETKSSTFHGASELIMNGDEAIWRPIAPKGKVTTPSGTYVELILRPSDLDQSRVERIIRENFNAILLGLYGEKAIHLSWKPGVRLAPWKPSLEVENEYSFKVDGLKCTACFWLTKDEFESPRGLDLVILGKRIKGNQWFNTEFEIKPEFSRRITGIVTADTLAKLLTTNKQELKGGNERTWLAFKKQISINMNNWLKSIGAIRETSKPHAEDLAAAREVSELVNKILKLPEFKLYNPWLQKTVSDTVIKSDNPDSYIQKVDGVQSVPGTGNEGQGKDWLNPSGGDPGAGYVSSDKGDELGERVRRRLRSGIPLNIDYQPENENEVWVTDEAVVVNKAHPIYRMFLSQGYSHEVSNMFRCVVMALIENADPAKKAAFDEVRRFYKSWALLGES
jgi:hypothetical protein